jgi:hypothetical protein
MRTIALVLLLCAPTLAFAQPAPKSIADCEKIKGDLAYNQCLANFGPKVGERRSRGVEPADGDDEPAMTRGRRGRSSYAGRGGRQRAVFDIGGRSRLRVSPSWGRSRGR